MANKKLHQAFSQLDLAKKDSDNFLPGILGFMLNGEQTVEVPGRNGYVYVRLLDNLNEVIQAYNSVVSPVYNLAVLLYRDSVDRTRYRIQSRDVGRYGDWGSYSAYLPRHGSQHSFVINGTGGGDIAWVYGNQFMPMLGMPSGSNGSMSVVVGEYLHYYNGTWQATGETGTTSFVGYKPTGSNARMVLVYTDQYGNPQLRAGSSYFTDSITGSAAVLPYLPALQANEFPVCGVRLVSGTSIITWANIYDLRDHFGGQVSNFYAKNDEHYLVVTGSSNLSNERVLTAGSNITITDGGAGGNFTISAPGITNTINGSGTANQVAYFVDPDTISSTTNIYVTGTSTFIGGTTDGIRVEQGGKLSLLGTATVFDDLQFQLIGQRLESPSSDIVQNNAESSLTYKNTSTLSDYATVNIQNTHRWATGTSLLPHIHFWQTSSLMPNWLLQYRVQVNGQQKSTSWVNNRWTSNAFSYSGTMNQISAYSPIRITGTYNISDIFQFRIIRDRTNSSGLFTGSSDGLGDVDAVFFDLHVEISRLGSNEEYSY